MNEGARPGDDTRLRILKAARELFGNEGFDGTTVRRIAVEVGLTDAALYHHFKSKREILNAIWELPIQGDPSRFEPEGQFSPGRLRAIGESVQEFFAANDHLQRLMCREILSGDKTALALRNQSRSIVRKTLQDHFKTVVSDAEAEIRAEAVLAVLTGSIMKTQMASGVGFADAVRTPDFRERIGRWVEAVGRLGEPVGI